MSVSEADRAYFQRIGEYEREGAAERLAAHLALPLMERLRRSMALSIACRHLMQDRKNDDPSPFYERAKQLGMYTP